MLAALLVIFAAGVEKRAAEYARAAGTLTQADDLPVYVAMAANLRYGCFLHDPRGTDQEFRANPYGYRSQPQPSPHGLRGFYQNDPGLSLLVAAAVSVFGNCAAPHELLLWLQIVVDSLNILLIFVLVRRLGGDAAGLAAALVYGGLSPVVRLAATFPYYYFWLSSFALWSLVLAASLLDSGLWEQRPARRYALCGVYGITLGFATLVRSSFLPLGIGFAVLFLLRWRRRPRAAATLMALLLLAQALLVVPLLLRSHARFGQWMPPRLVWHTAYVGMGWYPNPYGIRWDDSAGYELAAARGLRPMDPDWQRKYEDILRAEVLRIRAQDPWLWPRNTARNFLSGLEVFDEPLYLRISLGRISLSADLPRGRLLLLLLAFGVCAGGVLAWGGEERWAYATVLLQGAYFVLSVSLLCPPFLGYNAGYLPTLAVVLALAFGGLARVPIALRQVLSGAAVKGRPQVAVQSECAT